MNDLPPVPAELTLSEFARLARFKPSYVTQLKGEGRLVMSENGKRVKVAESLARIEETRDPSKAGVVARHAQERDAGTASPPPELAPTDDDDDEPVEPTGRVGSAFQQARALREQYMAELAGMDVAARRGELLDRDAVRAACAEAVTAFRTRLEGLSATLGPQIAPITDEARCTAMLDEHFEHLLEELERKFKAMTPELPA